MKKLFSFQKWWNVFLHRAVKWSLFCICCWPDSVKRCSWRKVGTLCSIQNFLQYICKIWIFYANLYLIFFILSINVWNEIIFEPNHCVYFKCVTQNLIAFCLLYRVGHKSLEKNAFKSQLLVSRDLWPTLYIICGTVSFICKGVVTRNPISVPLYSDDFCGVFTS
jgi:hypothetical protein